MLLSRKEVKTSNLGIRQVSEASNVAPGILKLEDAKYKDAQIGETRTTILETVERVFLMRR